MMRDFTTGPSCFHPWYKLSASASLGMRSFDIFCGSFWCRWHYTDKWPTQSINCSQASNQIGSCTDIIDINRPLGRLFQGTWMPTFFPRCWGSSERFPRTAFALSSFFGTVALKSIMEWFATGELMYIPRVHFWETDVEVKDERVYVSVQDRTRMTRMAFVMGRSHTEGLCISARDI